MIPPKNCDVQAYPMSTDPVMLPTDFIMKQTVYEHCKTEADVCRTVARDPSITERMRVRITKSAELWEARANRLSVKDGSRYVNDVDLTKIFDVKASVAEEAVATDSDSDDDDED